MLSVLKKLFFNWDKPRVYFWISRLFAPFFGRRVICRVCGKDFGKIITIIRGKKLAMIGLQKHDVRFAPCGVSELEFECVEHKSLLTKPRQEEEISLDKEKNSSRVLHVFLAHQSAAYVESYAAFHRRLKCEEDDLLLVYGGKEADFPTLPLERKVFCPDPRLRGTGYFQSYSDVFCKAWKWCIEHGERWDYIYFTESDHWCLTHGYTKVIPGMLQKTGTDFAGRELVNIEFSNNWFLANAREKDDFDQRLARFSGCNRAEYLHCLGTGLGMRWDVFEDFCSLKHDENACFLEIYLPSVFASRGWSGLNVNAHSEVYSHVRYRPLFTKQEFEQAQSSGVPFIHPYKM